MVNDAKAIPEDAIEAIRAARESGIRVAIASGRAWNEMNDVIEKLPCLRYFMCTNGAYVMDKDENRSLFHISFDKEQALHLLRKLLTYGVYVRPHVKDQIFGMYPPSRCITPERLGVCASDVLRKIKRLYMAYWIIICLILKIRFLVQETLACQAQRTITMHWRKATKQQR